MKPQFCQSCAMPMKTPEDFGTNADGSLNSENCNYCFQNGAYTAPDITMEEMLRIGLQGIDENPDMGGFMKFIIKKTYPMQIKKLKRWEK